MAHNRKFVPGMVDLVKVRFKNTRYIVGIQDEIENLIIDAHFLGSAPFKWIGLIYRYGLKNMFKPEYDRIDKKDGELPIAVELDSHILKWADEYDIRFFKHLFMIAGLEALLDVGKKYKLPIDLIAQERAKYGNIPNTIEECEEWAKTYKPKEALIELFAINSEAAKSQLANIFNNKAQYEQFKKEVSHREIPFDLLETLIDMTLSRSLYHQEKCEEIREIMKRNA